ncbi:MAG: alpha/beta hydrolase domain-containing protein [Acidimicrobiales bacterium]
MLLLGRAVIATLIAGFAGSACSSGEANPANADDGAAPHSAPSTTALGSAAAPGRVASPTVTPATGGRGEAFGSLDYDVGEFGYQEQEFLFGGRARSFAPVDLPPARYRSRMVVWTPTDPADFNGTTVVEWAQVSDAGDFELNVEINAQSPMLIEEGYAFVLVSVEQRGVCRPTPQGCPSTSLVGADPERYGSLRQPGDAYSFDIFNQAMQAIRFPTDVSPLGDLPTGFLIAEGFQRSIDKYFPNGTPDPPAEDNPLGVHGPLNAYLASGAAAAQLADAYLIDASAPAEEPALYRVPTLHLLDESAIRSVPVPDSENHVIWEVVGAPHADRWNGAHVDLPGRGPPEPKLSRAEELADRARFDDFGIDPGRSGAQCTPAPDAGSMFPKRYSLTAALAALQIWLETGVPAPAAPRAERNDPIPDDPAQTLRRDEDGNAIGGLRLPFLDLPVAAYYGEACIMAGTTIALTPARLADLYPTHQDYVEQLRGATDAAVEQGYLLCPDAETILRVASDSNIGGNDPFTAEPACA